jgi:hypothetical protein
MGPYHFQENFRYMYIYIRAINISNKLDKVDKITNQSVNGTDG